MTILFGTDATVENISVYEQTDGLCIGASFPINHGIVFVVGKSLGFKTVMWWTGWDVLKFRRVWHYRIQMKLWLWFVDEHWAVAEWLAADLPRSFNVRVRPIRPAWIHYCDQLLERCEK